MTHTSLFLNLPVELRYVIYSLLCDTEPISYPWDWSPVSSIDLRPPPLALQLTCRFLLSEIQTYYYGRAVLRVVSRAVELPLGGLDVACRKTVHLAKKVELLLVWDFDDEDVETNLSSWGIQGFLSGIVELLSEHAEKLELVIMSVRDACEMGVNFSFKKKALECLAVIPTKVRFVIDEVMAADEEGEALRQHL